MTVDPKFRVRQYEYDANGRQRWTARLDATKVATALYDGAGQRVETSAGGETRQIIYDAFGQMVAEYVGGVWARDYIYRGGQVIATMEAAGSTVRYVMSDLQGSARVTMDASGGILARHDYLPFGEEIDAGIGLRTTAQGYGAADERRQKYALLERDEETGQDHAWWRKYENLSGRWTTPDPYKGSMSVGDPQSFNRYAYVGNDPVNRVDPSGLDSSFVCPMDDPMCVLGVVTVTDSFAGFYASDGGPGGTAPGGFHGFPDDWFDGFGGGGTGTGTTSQNPDSLPCPPPQIPQLGRTITTELAFGQYISGDGTPLHMGTLIKTACRAGLLN